MSGNKRPPTWRCKDDRRASFEVGDGGQLGGGNCSWLPASSQAKSILRSKCKWWDDSVSVQTFFQLLRATTGTTRALTKASFGRPKPWVEPGLFLGCLPSWKLASGRGGFFYFIILLIFFYRFNTQKQILQNQPPGARGWDARGPTIGRQDPFAKILYANGSGFLLSF